MLVTINYILRLSTGGNLEQICFGAMSKSDDVMIVRTEKT